MKDKNRMIISVDTEKAFDKIQNPSMIRTFNKLGTKGMYLNIIKACMTSPKLTSYSMLKNLKAILLRSGTRQGCPLLLFLSSIVLEVLIHSIRQEKEI